MCNKTYGLIFGVAFGVTLLAMLTQNKTCGIKKKSIKPKSPQDIEHTNLMFTTAKAAFDDNDRNIIGRVGIDVNGNLFIDVETYDLPQPLGAITFTASTCNGLVSITTTSCIALNTSQEPNKYRHIMLNQGQSMTELEAFIHRVFKYEELAISLK